MATFYENQGESRTESGTDRFLRTEIQTAKNFLWSLPWNSPLIMISPPDIQWFFGHSANIQWVLCIRNLLSDKWYGAGPVRQYLIAWGSSQHFISLVSVYFYHILILSFLQGVQNSVHIHHTSIFSPQKPCEGDRSRWGRLGWMRMTGPRSPHELHSRMGIQTWPSPNLNSTLILTPHWK